MKDLLVGRHAVYTNIVREWQEAKNSYVETKRELFHGIIVALVVTGTGHYAQIVMLYHDGSLRQHQIDTITVEAEQVERL